MANSDISNFIDLTQDSYYFGNQDSILAHRFEVDQQQILENHIGMLANYTFLEIELEHEYDPESQLGISIPLPDLIMTQVSLPDVNPLPESVLNLCLFIMKLNHQSFVINRLNLTNFILLKVQLTN